MDLPSVLAPKDTAAAAAPQSGSLTGRNSLGKEEFLRLLVTQLANQDPLNPLEGHEFAAQLAQFSSVEQLINIDKTLGGLNEMQSALAQSMNSGVAAGLIGRTIEAEGNAVDWQGEGKVPLTFELGSAAREVSVTVRDASGQVVRTLKLNKSERGINKIEWDGTNEFGGRAAHGAYTFEVAAVDANGDPVQALSYIRGKVDRVSFGPEGIQAWIGKVAVPMSTVRSVEEAR